MAAAGMALSYGVPLEKIQEAVKAFQAVEHRIEFVTEKSGVLFTTIPKEPIRMRRSRASRRCHARLC